VSGAAGSALIVFVNVPFGLATVTEVAVVSAVTTTRLPVLVARARAAASDRAVGLGRAGEVTLAVAAAVAAGAADPMASVRAVAVTTARRVGVLFTGFPSRRAERESAGRARGAVPLLTGPDASRMPR
jgi:hypothetical protein